MIGLYFGKGSSKLSRPIHAFCSWRNLGPGRINGLPQFILHINDRERMAAIYPNLFHCPTWLSLGILVVKGVTQSIISLPYTSSIDVDQVALGLLSWKEVFCCFLLARTSESPPTEIQNSLDNGMNLSYAFSSPLWQPAVLVYYCPKGRKGEKQYKKQANKFVFKTQHPPPSPQQML